MLIENNSENLPFVIGGGVACNSYLRKRMQDEFNCHFVSPKFCTDNGAMVANYGLLIYEDRIEYPDCLQIDAQSRYHSKTSFIR